MKASVVHLQPVAVIHNEILWGVLHLPKPTVGPPSHRAVFQAAFTAVATGDDGLSDDVCKVLDRIDAAVGILMDVHKRQLYADAEQQAQPGGN